MVEAKLSDGAKQEAAQKIHDERAGWECSSAAILKPTFQSVAGQRARRAEQHQKQNAHGRSDFCSP